MLIKRQDLLNKIKLSPDIFRLFISRSESIPYDYSKSIFVNLEFITLLKEFLVQKNNKRKNTSPFSKAIAELEKIRKEI